MVDAGLLELVKAPVERWNDWRKKNTKVIPDFCGADLSGMSLAGANLYRANLSGARLEGADLSGANLNRASLFQADLSRASLVRATLFKANLSQADLIETNLRSADLSEAFLIKANLSGAHLGGASLRAANLGQASLFRADLRGAMLSQASFFKADLSEADLSEACLSGANLQEAALDRTILRNADISRANLCFATLIRVRLEGAVLDGSSVYGTSVWESDLKDCRQRDLDIMPPQQPVLSVDNLEVAQLICLLLHHRKALDLVESFTLNTALIIGRFPPERKPVIDAVKDAFRRAGYFPVALDFHVPGSRDLGETIKLLGRMSKFLIADLTSDPRISRTLDAVVHYLPSVPIQPIGEEGRENGQADPHYLKYKWVLPLRFYKDPEDLARQFDATIIGTLVEKAVELKWRGIFP